MKRFSLIFASLLFLAAMQRSVYKINPYTCDSCGRCVFACENNAIITDSLGFHIDDSLCDDCGDCVSECLSGAIFVRDGQVRISGSIFSGSTGFYLSGAEISLDTLTTTTDRFGNYYIELNPGTYNMTFSAAGYQDSTLVSQVFTADGCYQYNITLNDEITDIKHTNNFPKSTVKVSPNPFNPETNIVFSVEKDSNVEISVYNLKGQRLVTLLQKKVSKGEHSIRWDGRDGKGNILTSGTYLIRSAIGSKKTTSKAVLLK